MKKETRKELICNFCGGYGLLSYNMDLRPCNSCKTTGLDIDKMKDKINELEAKLDALQHKGDVKPDEVDTRHE